ncbi:hypothetical protein [Glaciecola sp. SC05]|uniref:hypothetical protein n=1 Tax=Glaciecola sp. SC05 TaxID=1987355 RepID=UPI0035291620
MKKPSRFMPKYVAEKPSAPTLFTVSAVFLGIVIYAPILLAILAGVALLVFAWSKIEEPKIEKYFLGLYNERSDESICEFAREFDPRVVDTWVIRAVYEQIQASLPTEQKVPIKASDILFEKLMLDEDTLDLDLLEEISQRTGRTLEGLETNPYYGRVTTARDLVLFFNHQARVHAT